MAPALSLDEAAADKSMNEKRGARPMHRECWLDGLSMVPEMSLSCIRDLTGGPEYFLLGAIVYTLLFYGKSFLE